MKRGYVYVLVNDAMPRLVKIGSTTRSPYERAAVLSGTSGVPLPFKVAMYAGFVNCRGIERWVHDRMAGFRINHRREFFRDALYESACWLYHHPERLSFASAPNLKAVIDVESFDELLSPWRAVM